MTALIGCIVVAVMVGACARALDETGLSAEQQRVLALDYRAFDQAMGHGWRAWDDRGEHAEAARLLDRYALIHDDLDASEMRMIRFHAGQMYAGIEDRPSAIERFQASIDPDEPPDVPLKWNAYVRGTIAFLERDLDALGHSRRKLAEQGECPRLVDAARLSLPSQDCKECA